VNATYVSHLSEHHVVVGYLSLATIGGWEPWAKDVPESLIIGHNGEWGEAIVNFSSSEWKKIVLNKAIPYILSKGYTGVFLDNVDYVDLYPEKKQAMVNLIRAIRERYPKIVIIVNRGFSVANEIAPYVNYVLFEDFVTYYSFSTKRYEIYNKGDLKWEFEQIKRLHALKVPVLALSYVDLSNDSQVRKFSRIVCSYAKEYNVSGVYMADVSLQRIGINPCEKSIEPSEEATVKTAKTVQETEREEKRICGPAFIVLMALTFILPLRRFL
jgi:uncharacterized protein (TIGR01370 family)